MFLLSRQLIEQRFSFVLLVCIERILYIDLREQELNHMRLFYLY